MRWVCLVLFIIYFSDSDDEKYEGKKLPSLKIETSPRRNIDRSPREFTIQAHIHYPGATVMKQERVADTVYLE